MEIEKNGAVRVQDDISLSDEEGGKSPPGPTRRALAQSADRPRVVSRCVGLEDRDAGLIVLSPEVELKALAPVGSVRSVMPTNQYRDRYAPPSRSKESEGLAREEVSPTPSVAVLLHHAVFAVMPPEGRPPKWR